MNKDLVEVCRTAILRGRLANAGETWVRLEVFDPNKEYSGMYAFHVVAKVCERANNNFGITYPEERAYNLNAAAKEGKKNLLFYRWWFRRTKSFDFLVEEDRPGYSAISVSEIVLTEVNRV